MAEVRYLVRDVDEAIGFYRDKLSFTVSQQFGPAMAILERGDLTLWLAGPMASASKPMPDGTVPAPGGGWGRFVLRVDDLDALVSELSDDGVTFRNNILEGPGGKQILCSDPSGNLIELFEVM